jgi:YVTN family beta-propeller protein
VESHRPSVLVRWWLPLCLLVVVLVLAAAKLGVRSVATGQPVLPGVAGAPVLGPAPTPTPTPGPARVGLRVRVTDPAGQPVVQALVEVRDRFNTAFGTQETGATGDAFLVVPANPAYVVTARKAGFSLGRQEGVEVVAPAATPNAGAAAGSPGASGQDRPLRFASARLVEIKLAVVEGAAPGPAASLPRLYVGHTTPRISLVDATANLLQKQSDPLGQGRQTFIAANKEQNRLFAAWSGSPDVLVLDAAELTVQRQTTVTAGAAITSLAVNPQNGRLWVSTTAPDATDSGILNELDGATQQVLRRLPVGPAAFNLRFRPDGSTLFVPQRSTNTLVLVDPASGQATATLRLAQWPTDLTLSADGKSLYMVNLGSEKLLEVDATTGEQRRALDVGNGANGVLLHPGGQRAFVLNQLFGYVQVIDLAAWQVVDLIPVGRFPQGMALSPDARSLYVANAGSGSVSVIDLDQRTVRDTLNIGGTPASLLLLKGQ